MFDYKCYAVIIGNDNMKVPWYLMAGYAYYCLDKPIITDGLYDHLENYILTNYCHLEHPHKHIIPYGYGDKMLSLLTYQDYPQMVKGAVNELFISMG